MEKGMNEVLIDAKIRAYVPTPPVKPQALLIDVYGRRIGKCLWESRPSRDGSRDPDGPKEKFDEWEEAENYIKRELRIPDNVSLPRPPQVSV